MDEAENQIAHVADDDGQPVRGPTGRTAHTIKGYIVHETWKGDAKGKYIFQKYPALKDQTNYCQIPVCPHDLTFEIPEGFDPTPEIVKGLRELQQKLRAEMSARILDLDRQINSLLAIENTVDA